MRRRLAGYFERKNCWAQDDLADETLNRVARRLEEEGITETEIPAKYCYIVARLVFLEYLRARAKDVTMRDEMMNTKSDAAEEQASRETRDRMLACLEQCAAKLGSADRELILRYYFGTERIKIENRRALAGSLGITINALSIRACRLRDKLENCMREHVGDLK